MVILKTRQLYYCRLSNDRVAKNLMSSCRDIIFRSLFQLTQFCDDADGPHGPWVDLLGQFKGVGVCQVRVGWGNGENDAVLFCDKLEERGEKGCRLGGGRDR